MVWKVGQAIIDGDPLWMRRIHGWLTIAWFLAAFPIMYWWSQSIATLVFISVYAIVAGHWSCWQAARVELKEDIRAEASSC